jgi:hypothetical protein
LVQRPGLIQVIIDYIGEALIEDDNMSSSSGI